MRLLVMSMVGVGLLISECAAQYHPPATPEAQFVQDHFECLRAGADGWPAQSYSLKPTITPPSKHPNATDPALNDQDPRTRAAIARHQYEAQSYHSCMQARGHKLRH